MPHIADSDSLPTENDNVIKHPFDGERGAEETLLVGPDGIDSTISCESASRESTPNSMSEEVPFPTNLLSAPEPLAALESIEPRGQIDRKSVTQPKKPKKKDSQDPGKPNPSNPKAPKPAPADPGKKDRK
ncbi:uncharacterized protein FOMMEDRAFT_31335 [Fomitiporia mediterranea MF3/22]|uniref:uncharacterized protein n=1 Tax=Fomitiporia mediterranea (strain MF3/22) TaxID=694068 RepID=UPI0004408519|nr:uncharacterized protein FOMMEDRAFT_31335 [Fomitiporia mediterranea MF3/22]EJC99266.1 hypothetical protein FOMMEDRAFT_31335 [Fomitiporia mediterranea MF3/22]